MEISKILFLKIDILHNNLSKQAKVKSLNRDVLPDKDWQVLTCFEDPRLPSTRSGHGH
jgi:hypothetical protein